MKRAQLPTAAFTLAEVMVAASLSTFILAGVLSAFLMLGRSSYAASGLPPGLGVNTSTGAITGTPTAPQTALVNSRS